MTSSMDRREFLATVTAASIGTTPVAAQQKTSLPAEGLLEPTYRPLPLGSIRPQGWLLRQLRIQADGLTGHLDEFWPDVGQSKWFGGSAEGWERAPYWLDGAIPLAWLLGDKPLQQRLSRYIGTIVKNQRPDGWFSPYPEDAVSKRYDLWAILLANKVLAQYHEATGDEAVLASILRSLGAMRTGIDRTPLYDWGRYRWFEGLIPIFYAYDKRREPWLLELAQKLRRQGFDYQSFYETEDVRVPTPRRGLWTWAKHVVNTGMALKAYGLAWRLSHQETDRRFPARMLEILDNYHGQANGLFSGDECLAGKNPIQGTELCAVVEFLYSLEILLSVFGDPVFGDRLERAAFNALPATFTPDMWAHQYDQQSNQVQCTINPDHMWSTNGPESNIYGLEPNFGCCTSNMHQGWPKFAAHIWMTTPDEGIAAVAYAPSIADFRSGGTPVTVSLETDYPFRENLSISVTSPKPVRFPLLLRIPAWARQAVIRVGMGPEEKAIPGTFHRIQREWNGTVPVLLRFPMEPKTALRYHGAVSLERGPLVYALKIGENWTRVNADKPHRQLPHGDFEVRPATPWNYGLALDPQNPASAVRFDEKPIGDRPFSPEGAGVAASVKGRKIPEWKMAHGWAAEIAPGLAESKEPLEELSLIPYGCTKIRITEFPLLKN